MRLSVLFFALVQLAEGLGKFLGKESTKKLINYNQSQETFYQMRTLNEYF